MTLRIEKHLAGQVFTLRLIGRLRSEDLEELRAQMRGCENGVTLDLEELTLVDADAVRLLRSCESDGVRLLHCSPYVREWINRDEV
jgi:anti-anti-sigma regulatory factor